MPIAPVDTIVVMKLIAGRTQDLADIEAIIESGADRDVLREAVTRALPDGATMARATVRPRGSTALTHAAV